MVKLNPFIFAIWGICDLDGCSSWYEMLESTLSAFFPLLSVSLIKVKLKAVRDKETFHFRDEGGISRGFLHVTMTDGKFFQGKSAQVAAKFSMCKCTWQTQDKNILWPPSWELPFFEPLQAHDISLYFENKELSHDKPRSHNLSSTGCTWVPQVADCRPALTARADSPVPYPAQQTHGNTLKFILYIIDLSFCYSFLETWFKQVQDLGTHIVLFSTVWNICSSASGFLLSHNISRHSDLDDFLTSSKLYSPLISQISARIKKKTCWFV